MIDAEIRKQLKPDGLLLGEDCVLTMLDQGFTTDSDVMRVGRKKDGSFKAASQVISQEDLGLLLSYTQKKAEQMMQQMAEGEIAVTPLKTGNHTSCDFCEYFEDAVFKWFDLLKEKKQYSLAFKFLLKAYDMLDKLDIDDNEGETYELSFSIINACSDIIMCMEDSERINAFNLLKQFLDNIRYYYDRVDILQVFFNSLKGEDFLKLQLDFVKEQLDYIDSHNDILDREYVLDDFAKQLADVATVEKAPKVEGRSMTMFLTEKR